MFSHFCLISKAMSVNFPYIMVKDNLLCIIVAVLLLPLFLSFSAHVASDEETDSHLLNFVQMKIKLHVLCMSL